MVYFFRVAARNANGIGPFSVEVLALTANVFTGELVALRQKHTLRVYSTQPFYILLLLPPYTVDFNSLGPPLPASKFMASAFGCFTL